MPLENHLAQSQTSCWNPGVVWTFGPHGLKARSARKGDSLLVGFAQTRAWRKQRAGDSSSLGVNQDLNDAIGENVRVRPGAEGERAVETPLR